MGKKRLKKKLKGPFYSKDMLIYYLYDLLVCFCEDIINFHTYLAAVQGKFLFLD